MNRFIKFCVTVSLCVLSVLQGYAEFIQIEGNYADYGLTEDYDGYYVIENAADLEKFRDYTNKSGSDYRSVNVVVVNDIVVNESVLDENGELRSDFETAVTDKWTKSINNYAGVFDGNGKKISGLYISYQYYVGLFTDPQNATIKNVTIVDSYFKATGSIVGGITGSVNGSATCVIENCLVQGYIFSNGDKAGGIYGGYERLNMSISNCTFYGTVVAKGNEAGGISSNDVTISDCHNYGTVEGVSTVGGIVGYTTRFVTNCSNEGTVISTLENCGGICGQGRAENCSNKGKIVGKNYVGGIIGKGNGNVSYCYNEASVSGENNVGGIAGSSSSASTISYSCNSGSVSGIDEVGGIVGFGSGKMTDVFNIGSVSANAGYVGGLAGEMYSSVANSYSACIVTNNSSTKTIGALFGNYVAVSPIISCYYDSDVCPFGPVNNAAYTGCTAMTSEEMCSSTLLTGMSSDYWTAGNTGESGSIMQQDDEFATQVNGLYPRLTDIPVTPYAKRSYYNIGTADDPDWVTYKPIYTIEDLSAIASDNSGRYVLMNNIVDYDNVQSDGTLKETPGHAWIPIGTTSSPFTGELYGRGKTISGLSMTASYANAGIFTQISHATIKDVNIGSCRFLGKTVGTLVARVNNSTIKNCSNYSNIELSSITYIGGICGYADTVVLENCHNYGVIDGGSSGYCGGICGYFQMASIQECTNNANISGSTVGGIWGYSYGMRNTSQQVLNCINNGDITAIKDAGGIAGDVVASSYLYYCMNTGTIRNTGSGATGGIIGRESSGDNLYYCLNIGSVEGVATVGALCGKAGALSGLYNYYDKDICKYGGVSDQDYSYAKGLSTSELANGSLPTRFPSANWGIKPSEIINSQKYKYYPYIKAFGEESAKLAQLLDCPTVTLNYIGGTSDEDLTFYVETEGATLPSDVTQLGFTFGGWYSNSNYAGSPITEITVDETGPKTYYAKWSVNNYSVTLNTDGGIINRGNITSYNYGFSGTLPTDVTKTGYTFAGWYEVPRADLVLSATNITGNISNALLIEKALVNASGNGVEYWREKILSLVNNIETEIVVAANADATTLNKYLKELAKTSAVYSIDYDIDALHKTGCDLILESYNESALSATVAAIRGINGCSLVEARALVLNSPSTIIDNVSLEDIMAYKAQLEAVGATVSYINYDEVESLVSTDYGDRCYKAKWNVNTYNVVLEANGGKNENVINEYTYGIGVTLPDDSEITRTGYTFGGWYLNSSFTGDMFTEISDSDYGDKIYYAKWTANEYEVVLNANGGTINSGDIEHYVYGTYNLLPTDVTRRGYTFGGWYEVKEGESAGANVTDVYLESAGAQKLLVVKLVKEYLGLGLKEAKDLVDSAPSTLVTQMDREAADRFLAALIEAGASASLKNALGGVATRAIAITDYGNKEFEAKWLVNTYTVTLQANGGTINSGNVTEYVYGALKSLPTNVTREGYTFAGWYTTSSLDGNIYFAITATETGNKTFYAKWDVNSYAVTLDTDGGSINSGNISSYTYGVGAILPTDVTKIGFTFNGWIDDETAALATNIANNAVEAKYYTASWSQIDYTITYNANGGTSISSDTYHYEDEVTLPEPTRTGYNFLGWYNNSNLVGTAITTIEDTEYGNKEFWAKWEANTYAVTLNVNSGEINSGNIASYTYDVLAILPQDVTKTGNTFGGWFDNEACTGTAVTQIVKGSTGNKAYYAKWTPKTYTVTLQTNNGTINAGNIASYTYNVGATLPTDVTKNGYEFVGWFDNSSYEGGVVTEIAATEVGDRNFWAKWKNASYAVALNANGGSINSNNIDSYVYGAGVVLPTDVTKTGYRFLGWKDSENNDALAISATDFGNKAFTAQWAKATYTITYDANGGDIDDTYEVSYQLGDAITLPTTVTKAGNTFVAWYDNVNLIGEPVTEIAAIEVGDKNYYAKWQANTYTVTLDAQEGTINTGNVTAYTYGVTTSLPTNVTREGYTFTGWYTNAECTGDVVSIISSTTVGNQTYYAGWSNTAYAVTLNTNNGVISAGSVISYTHGTAVQLPTTAQIEKTGYTFAGWYDNSSCTGTSQTSIAATATGDKAFWAKWTVNTYDITLNSNEGTINSGNVTKYTYGVGATLPTDITKTGCTFAGWYTTATFTGESVDRIDEYALDAKTFYAKWTENDYSIVYETSGGVIENVGYATNYTFGTGATLPNTVSKTGYTFAGWFTNSAYEGVAVEEISETEYGKKTYYAKWNVNSYAVTFNSNGGVINNGEINSYSYGVGATLPTNVTKSGYTFAGWYNNEELAGVEVKTIATNAYGEKNFWAKWVINTYTITLNANGGVINAGSVSDYEFATGATLPTNVTRDGYEFAGWYNNSNLTGERILTVGATETGNKSYYAKWSVLSYLVTLNTNGGTVNSGNVVAYTYSNGATLPIDVTKTGCKFGGWYANADFTGDAVLTIALDEIGDKAYFAKWTPNTYAVELVVNDGTINSGNVSTYKYGEGAVLPTDITKDGYTFNGWYANSGLSGEEVYEIGADEVGNKTYYAKWSANTYKISLYAADGTINGAVPTEYTYGTLTILPTNVTREGYTFDGWYKTMMVQLRVSKVSNTNMPEIVAVVTRHLGSNYVAKISYVELDSTVLLSVPQYKMSDISDDLVYEGFEVLFSMLGPSASVSSCDVNLVSFGENPTKIIRLVKSYFGKTISGDEQLPFVVAENVPLETFEKFESEVLSIGGIVEMKNGYFSGEQPVVAIYTTDKGDKLLEAHWTVNSYNVTLEVNGGTNTKIISDYTYGEGAALPTSEEITRAGHTFAGWFTSSNFDGEAVTEISKADVGNKTFYAKWNVNNYAVTLNTNEGSINSGNVTNYVYGNGANLPSDVTKTGYKFAGWYNVTDSTKQVVRIDEETTGDQAFFAKWTANSYNVILVVN
ncbi:MAG: ribosomal protein L7/L12, partial [Bacteroidales bacterium]|nr:ribosomal protein L7/L12 [Bacteroidales bacterium]